MAKTSVATPNSTGTRSNSRFATNRFEITTLTREREG
jgi:hypothetical protein